MRKIILVAAMLLASASAQAGGSRGLSLAAAGEQVSAPQTTMSASTGMTQLSEAAPATEAPKYSDRPPAVSLSAPAAPAAPTATAPTTASAPVTTAKPASKSTASSNKPKPKRSWTERRIISELHRHGIYW
ncbi:hypothetical protein C7U92_10265 [Bradyrhizobium sp. WBOS7]|uniref:Uncharacterized protein n=1 Tax=Bradyrhizobium betae TaxID=244734 RepID=A0AAE9N4U7_9BRAD|nr:MULTISPECIES: hypothetical protein [Bradyrhizobium]MDD1573066.1 hypothetical protein [Bradyrhizobium sp. WBOS1]UUO33998.1 hypothetical protein DCK84_05025 [Bradyrhizobium sp. WBOS01]MDD1528565.1 hypothetical protein [Bradyrhizobium sp. WBOS2]MDD1577113.1 hypothetical protein [Bradyrhizobium sp. WBOS7]MDD1600160.1 hypothetical protein [Bradyrhizobium sp. WBOS16]